MWERKRGKWDRKWGMAERCCVVFVISENMLAAWQQINNPSITKHNAIKTAEYGCKPSTFQKWPWCNIKDGVFSVCLSSPRVVSKSRGYYIDVPSDEIHFCFFLLPALCKKKVPVMISMWMNFCFLHSFSVKHHSPLII